jgi:hypothetical protein
MMFCVTIAVEGHEVERMIEPHSAAHAFGEYVSGLAWDVGSAAPAARQGADLVKEFEVDFHSLVSFRDLDYHAVMESVLQRQEA